MAEIPKPIWIGKLCLSFWGGEFWGKGYFTNTFGHHGTEKMISNYVKNQGMEKEYEKLKVNHQLELFS